MRLVYKFQRVLEQASQGMAFRQGVNYGDSRIAAALTDLIPRKCGYNFRFIQAQIVYGQVEGMNRFRVRNFSLRRRVNCGNRWTGGTGSIVNRRGGG